MRNHEGETPKEAHPQIEPPLEVEVGTGEIEFPEKRQVEQNDYWDQDQHRQLTDIPSDISSISPRWNTHEGDRTEHRCKDRQARHKEGNLLPPTEVSLSRRRSLSPHEPITNAYHSRKISAHNDPVYQSKLGIKLLNLCYEHLWRADPWLNLAGRDDEFLLPFHDRCGHRNRNRHPASHWGQLACRSPSVRNCIIRPYTTFESGMQISRSIQIRTILKLLAPVLRRNPAHHEQV